MLSRQRAPASTAGPPPPSRWRLSDPAATDDIVAILSQLDLESTPNTPAFPTSIECLPAAPITTCLKPVRYLRTNPGTSIPHPLIPPADEIYIPTDPECIQLGHQRGAVSIEQVRSLCWLLYKLRALLQDPGLDPDPGTGGGGGSGPGPDTGVKISNQMVNAFLSLNGFEVLIRVIQRVAGAFVSQRADVEFEGDVLELITSVMDVLDDVLPLAASKGRFESAGGWTSLAQAIAFTGVASSAPALGELFGLLIGFAIGDRRPGLFDSGMKNRKDMPNELYSHTLEEDIRARFDGVEMVRVPEAIGLLFSFWQATVGAKPDRSPKQRQLAIAVVKAVSVLVEASARNGVAIHRTGVLGTLIRFVVGDNQKMTDLVEADAIRHLCLKLLEFGVDAIETALYLFSQAENTEANCEFLLEAVKISRAAPFIEFDGAMAVGGRCLIEYPELGAPFPPIQSPSQGKGGGYSVAAWVRVERFDLAASIVVLRLGDEDGKVIMSVTIDPESRCVELSTGPSTARRVKFASTPLKQGKWHHIAIVHGRKSGGTSQRHAHFFLDGELVERARVGYPVSPTSQVAPTSALGSLTTLTSSLGLSNPEPQPVIKATVGLARASGAKWLTAGVHLFADILSNQLLSVIANLGPRYFGNYQDSLGGFQTYQSSAGLIALHEQPLGLKTDKSDRPTSRENESADGSKSSQEPARPESRPGEGKADIVAAFRQRAGNVLDESIVILGLVPSGVVQTGVSDHLGKEARQVLTRLQGGAANSATACLDAAFSTESRVGVLVGGPVVGMPFGVDDAASSVAGAAALSEKLVSQAKTPSEVLCAVRVVCALVEENWRNSESMERERGFAVLASVIQEQIDRLGDGEWVGHLFSVLASFVGLDENQPSRGVLANAVGYRALIVELEAWRKLNLDVQRRFYAHFDGLVHGNRFRVFNAKRLIRMRVLGRLLETATGESVPVAVSRELVSAVRALIDAGAGRDGVRMLAGVVAFCRGSSESAVECGDDNSNISPRALGRGLLDVLASAVCDPSFFRRRGSASVVRALFAACEWEVSMDEMDSDGDTFPTAAHSSIRIGARVARLGDDAIMRAVARKIARRVDLPAAWIGVGSIAFSVEADSAMSVSSSQLGETMTRLFANAPVDKIRPDGVCVLVSMVRQAIELIEAGASVDGNDDFGTMVRAVIAFLGRVGIRSESVRREVFAVLPGLIGDERQRSRDERRSSVVLVGRPELEICRPVFVAVPAVLAPGRRKKTHLVTDELVSVAARLAVSPIRMAAEFRGIDLIAGPEDDGDVAVAVAVLIGRISAELIDVVVGDDYWKSARTVSGCCRCVAALADLVLEGAVPTQSVVAAATAVLDAAGAILERPEPEPATGEAGGKSKIAALCRPLITAVRGTFRRLALVLLCSEDANAAKRVTYWLAVGVPSGGSSYAISDSADEFSRFSALLLLSAILTGPERVSSAATDAWRIQCVREARAADLVGDGKLIKVLQMENDAFVAWLETRGLGAIDAVRISWEAYAASESRRLTAATTKRRLRGVEICNSRSKSDEAGAVAERTAAADWASVRQAAIGAESRRRRRTRRDAVDSRQSVAATRAALGRNEEGGRWRLDETEGRDRMRLRLIPEWRRPVSDPDEAEAEPEGDGDDGFCVVDDPDTRLRRVLRSLDDGDRVEGAFNVARIDGLVAREGLLIVGKIGLYVLDGLFRRADNEVVAVEQAPADERDPFVQRQAGDNDQDGTRRWDWSSVVSLSRRRYLLRDVALEAFFADGRSVLVTTGSTAARDSLFSHLAARAPKPADPDAARRRDAVRERGPSFGARVAGALGGTAAAGPVTARWVRGQMSNFAYLMWVNSVAGRTFNDLTQYPVFPWVVADYTSSELKLDVPRTFRDLSKPMGAQDDDRATQFKCRFEELSCSDEPAFHYGTHYSSAMVVAQYLVRLQPFADAARLLQGGAFDRPDRLFHSVGAAWQSAAHGSMADVRELTPEFFCLPDFLSNVNRFDFGSTQTGEAVSDVRLPAWAHGDPILFVRRHRAALESDYVSRNLHLWLDLVFGLKQRGAPAVEAVNVFHHLSYSGAVDLDSLDDPIRRKAAVGAIRDFGQTPVQAFFRPHPARTVLSTTEEAGIGSLDADGVVARLCRKRILTGDGRPITSLAWSDRTNRPVWMTSRRVSLGPSHETVVEWGFVDHGVRFFDRDPSSPKLRGLAEHLHPGPVATIVSAGNGVVASAGKGDSAIGLWTVTGVDVVDGGTGDADIDPLSLKPRAVLRGHSAPVSVLAACPSLATLVSAGNDGSIVIWDLNRLGRVRRLDLPTERVARQMAVSSLSGDIVLGCADWIVVLTVNGRVLVDQHVGPVSSVAVMDVNDGNWPVHEIVVTGGRGKVTIWAIDWVQPDGQSNVRTRDSSKHSIEVSSINRSNPISGNRRHGHGWGLVMKRQLEIGSDEDVTSLLVRGDRIVCGGAKGGVWEWTI